MLTGPAQSRAYIGLFSPEARVPKLPSSYPLLPFLPLTLDVPKRPSAHSLIPTPLYPPLFAPKKQTPAPRGGQRSIPDYRKQERKIRRLVCSVVRVDVDGASCVEKGGEENSGDCVRRLGVSG